MRPMVTSRDNRIGTALAQNAMFIRSAYRKAVITGMVAIMSAIFNVFVDGILVGRRIGPDALAAINLSLPGYLTPRVLGALNRDPGATPREPLKTVREEIDAFAGKAPQFEDITMLNFQYTGREVKADA